MRHNPMSEEASPTATPCLRKFIEAASNNKAWEAREGAEISEIKSQGPGGGACKGEGASQG